MSMTSAEAAQALGTDARTLRAFLRKTPGWNNPGSRGRYEFTEADITKLRQDFQRWSTKHKARVVAVDATPATPRKAPKRPQPDEIELAYVGTPIPPRLTGVARMEANARVDRLEMLLRSRGLHVSQSGDRYATRTA